MTWGIGGAIIALTIAFVGLSIAESVRQQRAAQQRVRDLQARSVRDRSRIADRERRRSEYDATYREEVRAAEERARGLLLSHLDAQQQAQLIVSGSFQVVGSNGGRYTVRTGNVSNVVDSDGLTSYCLYAPNVPISDSMLMQKLLLETDETKFVTEAIT